MPRLTVWSVRAALVYLAAGFTLGALMLWNKGLPFNPALLQVLPTHIDFLMFGWMVQLVMRVGFWILPRLRSSVRAAPRRGNETLAWLAVALLNLGVWLAGVGPALHAPEWLVLAGRALEAGSAAVFALHAWPRIKPPGS
ncbi:MAG TPA: hypothetical protein VF498_21150 [Anaerolineales bacterium]